MRNVIIIVFSGLFLLNSCSSSEGDNSTSWEFKNTVGHVFKINKEAITFIAPDKSEEEIIIPYNGLSFISIHEAYHERIFLKMIDLSERDTVIWEVEQEYKRMIQVDIEKTEFNQANKLDEVH